MKIVYRYLPILLVLLLTPSCYNYKVPKIEENKFTTMKYTDIGKPTFEDSKKYLPIPIIDGNKELLGMYWYCWELTFKHIKKPTANSGFPSNFLDEAFKRHIFQ